MSDDESNAQQGTNDTSYHPTFSRRSTMSSTSVEDKNEREDSTDNRPSMADPRLCGLRNEKESEAEGPVRRTSVEIQEKSCNNDISQQQTSELETDANSVEVEVTAPQTNDNTNS